MSSLFKKIRERKLEQASEYKSVANTNAIKSDFAKSPQAKTISDAVTYASSKTATGDSKDSLVKVYSKSEMTKAIEQVETQSNKANIPDTETIPEPESREAIELDDTQLSAITMALKYKYSNLIGYAGTGKTTTVLEMVRALIKSGKIRRKSELRSLVTNTGHLDSYEYNFAIVAFTGLAVKTLRRVVPNEFKCNCNTIHKLIDFGPVEREIEYQDDKTREWVQSKKKFFEPRRHNGVWLNEQGFPCDEHDPKMARRDSEPVLLPYDQIIIDEISMVGVGLLKMLLKALPDHCRITTIGDLAQLQPVLDTAIHPVLLNRWPSTELTKIYRQKEGDVISNANLIRQGKVPSASENFRILGIDKQANIAAQQVEAFITKCFKDGSYDPKQDILITPTNTGILGQEMLNIRTRQIVNPDNDVMLIKTMRNQSKFAVGDRVINVKNDNEIGVYNGMLGWINHIAPNEGINGSHYHNSNLTRVSKEQQLDLDIDSELADIEQKQKEEKQRAKVQAMFGGGIFEKTGVINEDKSEDENQGTGIRKASHYIETQFDYLEEDDAGGLKHLHLFETSSQIENLKLAYWITVHKSQGSGFRNVFICLHDTHGAQFLCNELLYTAVTRCMENVTIMTTKFALNRCVNNMRIKGDSMASKIDSYCEGFNYDKLKGLDLPVNDEKS